MADNTGKLELVVEVDANKANASIKSINTGLSSVEQGAAQMARGASQSVDGMTASMVKGATAGNLLADAIKRALEFAKEWTIEAAKESAHAERAVAITRTLAKSHGDGAAAAQKAIDAIRAVGFAASDATTSVQKLIIADIGLDKAQSLAKIAKDAAAVNTEGLDAAQAFEKLMQAIETGRSRGLRTMSLFPKMAEAEEVARLQAQLHGKTLSDLEVKQVRYNTIVEAARTIQGAAAEAAGTFDGQMAKLSRDMKDLKEDVGKAFQGELQVAVSILKSMVKFFGDHTDAIEKFGKGTLVLVGIIATVTAATKAWALAQGALNLVMAVNPAFLLAGGIIGGIIGAGAIIYKEYSDMHEGMEARYKQMETDALRRDVGTGKVKIDDLRKRGMTDDQIRELISGRSAVPGLGGEDITWGGGLGMGFPKLKIGGAGQPNPEALKLQLEIQKRQVENERYFKDQAIAAGGAGKTGYAKEVAELNSEIARRTSFVDDKGIAHQVALTKTAWDSIIEQAKAKWQAFKDHFTQENKKTLAEYLKDEEEAAHKQLEWESKRYQERLKNDVDIADKNFDHLKDVYAFEEQRAGFGRDAKLRQLEGADAETIPQKIAVEQQKAQIEIDYLNKVHEVKNRLYDMDTSRMLMEEELTLKRLGYKADEITARIAELTGQRKEIRDQGDDANDEAVKAARENASNRSAQLVRDHNKQIFDSLKQQAGGVFDALLSKSQSVWSAIGNSLKTALLTAIKDVVTSRIAAMLMNMFAPGSGPQFRSGGGSSLGFLGALGMGAVPAFAGGGAGASGGGTSGFAGPVGGGAGVGGSGTGGASGIMGMQRGGWGSLKSLAGFGSMVKDSGGDRWVNINNHMIPLDSAGNIAMVAATSPAAMAAGGLLATGGLLGSRRGTWGGVAMGTAGGALLGAGIGMQFGGPAGALLGAGIGAVAGFGIGIGEKLAGVETPEAEAKRLVKQLYQVNIDTAMAKQIVDLAKQKYSGHVSIAVRDPDIRKVIELYAAATGQHMPMSATTPHGASLMEQGGNLYQAPTYMFGNPNVYQSSLPTAGGPAGQYPSPMMLQLNVSGQGAAQFVAGQVVTPEFVQSQWSSAAASSNGRVSNSAWMQQPGLITG